MFLHGGDDVAEGAVIDRTRQNRVFNLHAHPPQRSPTRQYTPSIARQSPYPSLAFFQSLSIPVPTLTSFSSLSFSSSISMSPAFAQRYIRYIYPGPFSSRLETLSHQVKDGYGFINIFLREL